MAYRVIPPKPSEPQPPKTRQQRLDEETIVVVPFLPWACPRCGNKKPRTYSQADRLRYHECRTCDLKFKSLEITPEDLINAPALRGVF